MRTVSMNRSDRVGNGARGAPYVSCGLFAMACAKQKRSCTIRFINDGNVAFHHITA